MHLDDFFYIIVRQIICVGSRLKRLYESFQVIEQIRCCPHFVLLAWPVNRQKCCFKSRVVFFCVRMCKIYIDYIGCVSHGPVAGYY